MSHPVNTEILESLFDEQIDAVQKRFPFLSNREVEIIAARRAKRLFLGDGSMNEPKEQTYTVLWGMCTATYYVVKAKNEDEAVDRSGYNYDPDEEWAVETYENGLVIENCHWAETTCEDEEEEE